VSSNRKPESVERQARLAAVRASQRKAERTRSVIIWAVSGVVALALVGTTVAVITNQNTKNDARDAAVQAQAGKPIDGVTTFTGLARDHVGGKVAYGQNPPTGGDHSAVDQNCGFYSTPVLDENAVHSLEHGAVWITHNPNLPAAQVDLLRGLAAADPFVLVSPRDGLPTPVVASAWGIQLQLPDADDPRLAAFVTKYVNGPQTPEPGAACAGGVGDPE